MKPIKAWHFARQDRRLGFDGGLHASKNILNALDYSSGPIICRVELFGEMIEDTDKIVARRRKCLWWIDGQELLRKFARMCALDVIGLWDAPEIVVRYLKSGDETIRNTARDAAWAAAARDAAWDAARDAAWDAARTAARDAAWAAARRDAAWAAARRDAAWAAARKKQARRLESMVRKERKKK